MGSRNDVEKYDSGIRVDCRALSGENPTTPVPEQGSRRMHKKSLAALSAAIMSFLITATGFPMYDVIEEGVWPESWPEELESLRPQSRTLDSGGQRLYEIPFTNREQFESLWPHMLSVMSKNAKLTLINSPDDWFGLKSKAGVRILSPLTGVWVDLEGATYPSRAKPAIPDRGFLQIGPPWPDSVQSESGALPEFVIIEDGKWASYEPKARANTSARKATIEELREEVRVDFLTKRARIDIQLIIDGDIVDLNRIRLPADTPIIDWRFENGSKPNDGK